MSFLLVSEQAALLVASILGGGSVSFVVRRWLLTEQPFKATIRHQEEQNEQLRKADQRRRKEMDLLYEKLERVEEEARRMRAEAQRMREEIKVLSDALVSAGLELPKPVT